MNAIIQKEIKDTHKKIINAIELDQLELASKYKQCIKDLMQQLKSLDK